MKVVFVSNYFNHHQKPFCEEMYKELKGFFAFIATSVMREERKQLGYNQDDQPEYVCLAYQGDGQMKKALDLIDQAEVVIIGSAPNNMVLRCIRKNKLVFRYTERPYKKTPSYIKKIYHFWRWHQNDLWKNNVYMLCASAYAYSDYASVGMYKKRSYKWGYFPEIKKYDIDELVSKKEFDTLLWCGRFIDWKHPDDAIQIARKLKEEGYKFRLNMIGTGVMESELKQLVKEFSLDDVVTFCGSMSPEQVRSYMEKAGIYLFTSDKQEGWGAVLNEAMNSACAVVASHAIGSVPFLLKDGKNGYVYESGNIDSLYTKVKYLLDHPENQQIFGSEAYKTMITEWNAEVATKRFINLADRINMGENKSDVYQTGPCSNANLMKDDWR